MMRLFYSKLKSQIFFYLCDQKKAFSVLDQWILAVNAILIFWNSEENQIFFLT